MNTRQYAITLFYKFSDIIKPVVITPFFIKQYGTDSFGIYTALFAFCLLIYPLIDLGISFGSQRFLYRARNEERKFSRNLMLIQTAVYAVFSATICGIFSKWQESYSLPIQQIVTALLFGFTLSISNTLSGFFRAFGKFSQLVKIKSIFDVIEFLSLLTWIHIATEYDYRYFLVLSLTRILFICRCYFSIFGGISQDTTQNYPDPNLSICSFFKDSLPIVPLALVGSINSNASRFFIGHTLGATEIGIFSVVSMYIFYLKYIAFPITFAGTAGYAKLYDSGSLDQLTRSAASNIAAVSAMTLFSAIFIYFLDKFIFYELIGMDFYYRLDYLVAILAVGVVAANANSIMSALLSVFGNISELNQIALASMLVNLTFMAFTINELGLLSPALALLGSTLFETFMMALLTCKRMKLRLPL